MEEIIRGFEERILDALKNGKSGDAVQWVQAMDQYLMAKIHEKEAKK
jgi:hypothetical protein